MVQGAMSTAQRRPGRAGDAAEAPVRVRTRGESLQWAFSNWCRIISVVILFVGFLGAVIYASAKLRFVEDVLPRISGASSCQCVPPRTPTSRTGASLPAISTRTLPRPATHEPPSLPPPPSRPADPLMFWLFNVVVASFAVIPGAASATSIAAGVIYGTPVGVALVSTSCAVGAGVSFLIARYAARPLVERVFVKEGSRFAVLDQAVMRDGAQIVLLARLSPVSPYVAMSFMFGLTAVDFLPYIGASAVGILPACFVYVYMGDTGRRATGGGGKASGLELAFYAFGLLMTVLVTYRIAQIAQKTLGDKGLGFKVPAGRCFGLCGGGSSSGDPDDDDDDDDIGEELLEVRIQDSSPMARGRRQSMSLSSAEATPRLADLDNQGGADVPFGSQNKKPSDDEAGEGRADQRQFLLVSDPTDATMSVPEASPEQVRQVRRTANAARLL